MPRRRHGDHSPGFQLPKGGNCGVEHVLRVVQKPRLALGPKCRQRGARPGGSKCWAVQDSHSIKHVKVSHAGMQAFDLLECGDRGVDAAPRGLLGAFVQSKDHHPAVHDQGLRRKRRTMSLPAGHKLVQVQLNLARLVLCHPAVGQMDPNPGGIVQRPILHGVFPWSFVVTHAERSSISPGLRPPPHVSNTRFGPAMQPNPGILWSVFRALQDLMCKIP